MRDTPGRVLATVLAVMLVTSTMAVPVAAAATTSGPFVDKQSGSVQAMDTFLGFKVPDSTVTYGSHGDPGFIVKLEPGSRSTLTEWANQSSRRVIIEFDNNTDIAMVSAPPAAVIGGFWIDGLTPRVTDGLVSQSYVKWVDTNSRMGTPEPVGSLLNESAYSSPAPNVFVRGKWSASGVAFSEDANLSLMADVRENVGGTGVSHDGTGIRVSVIDTGVNTADGKIYGNGSSGSDIRIAAAKNFISNKSANVTAGDYSAVADGNGHGSWVASAVAANYSETIHDGMAPNSTLLVAKALDDDGGGNTQDIADAVRWSERNGADVISMSLGSPKYSPSLASAMKDALAGNTTMILVAVGNSRMNPATRFINSPADVPASGVVGVAATTAPESVNKTKAAYFSNVGPDDSRDLSNGVTVGENPDIGAPGMEIRVKVGTTNDVSTVTNSTLSGTSMATPIVAGAVAVGLDANSGWLNNSATTRDYLLNTTTPIEQAGVTEVGNGQLNVSNFVNKVSTTATQEAARNTDATGRDEANAAYSKLGPFRYIAAGRELVGGVAL